VEGYRLTAIKGFNVVRRVDISWAQKSALYHASHRPRSASDAAYLDALARRLADAAGLPFELARRRVKALAISAQPKPASPFGMEGRSR
jgi:hypothetical protein